MRLVIFGEDTFDLCLLDEKGLLRSWFEFNSSKDAKWAKRVWQNYLDGKVK